MLIQASEIRALAGAALALALAAGCSREEVGVTAVTAATQPTPVATEPDPASWRLAHELCKRRASCVEDGPGGSSIGSVASAECITQERPRLRAMLASWDCSPAAERARIEECLVAMKVARCEPLLTGDDALPLCPANVECGPHAAAR